MQLNIFNVPTEHVSDLETKFRTRGMSAIAEVRQQGWFGRFFYSTKPVGKRPAWIEEFSEFFEEDDLPKDLARYAAFVFVKEDACRVLAFGKSHFYIRPFCDYDFGIELAKRVANEGDIRQTAATRYNSRRRKQIRSMTRDSPLDVESGESLDYVQSGVLADHRSLFGKSARFGTSVKFSADCSSEGIGLILDGIEEVLDLQPKFQIPRTVAITETEEVERLDSLLVDELTSCRGLTEFSHNSYDLYGVDFVFDSSSTFTLMCPGKESQELGDSVDG